MIQTIRYKCCNVIFAACTEPECYTDDDWVKELKKYVERGDIVEMKESANVKFGKCDCKKELEQLKLF